MLRFYLEDLRMENQNYLYNKDYGVGHHLSLKNIYLRKLKSEIK